MATPPVAAPDPSPAQLRLEALKLLKDWSVWMVTFEIAGIGWLLAKTESSSLPLDENFKKLTIVAFAFSVAFAAWVLSGIVSLVQRVSSEQALNKAGIYVGIAFFLAAVVKGCPNR